MPILLENFDQKSWIRRLGNFLEDTLAKARHTQVPFWFPRSGPIETFDRGALEFYREMAHLATRQSSPTLKFLKRAKSCCTC